MECRRIFGEACAMRRCRTREFLQLVRVRVGVRVMVRARARSRVRARAHN